MAELELRKVEHWQRRKRVLGGLSLKAPPGRVTALLGDADSGRVAVLKVVAGIEKAHGGAILVDGADVTRARPGGRDVATVFRAAALMPHKSAYENIAYPLRLARFDRETIEARVAAVAEHFGLTDALDLRPRKLTDLQCFQIGLARALVRDPAIYLFELPPPDDAALRDLAIAETRRLRGEFGRTVLFATESAEEARSLADWIVVLHEGRKLQMGRPSRLIERPASRRVARLLGAKLRAALVLETGADGVALRLKDDTELSLPGGADSLSAGDRATLAIWPEHIRPETGAPRYPPERCYLFAPNGRLAHTPHPR